MYALLSNIILATVATFFAKASAQTLPANCDRNTTVTPGETCDSISAAYNVSTYQLAAVNAGIIDPACDNLQAYEVICLGIAGQDCNTTYVVQSGNTCSSIANAYNISLNTLLTNNPNLNPICTNLYPGEVLCTSSTIYVNLTTA